jgi:restriction endonuclease S subunit
LNDLTYATTVKHLSSFDILSERILCPSGDEQRPIADYLDAETAQIDAVVAARRAQMDLLRVRLRAAIDEQLDKVLVAWRLKHLLTGPLEYGASEAAGDDDPTWPRYVRTTDIDDDGGLRPETFRSLPPAVAAPYLLRGGDLLLTRSGATVGKSLLWREKWGPACYAGYLIRARPDPRRVVPGYLDYFVRSSRYWDEIRLTTIQATIPNVNAERYGDLRVPLPSLDEQVSIVRQLDAVRKTVHALSQVMTNQVDMLLERREALITAAVTGQLEIPGAAA